MARSFNIQEIISGNQREKSRALQAAQSALNYAEWWLNQGNNTTGSNSNCSGISTTLVVCGSNSGTPPTYNNNSLTSSIDPTQLDTTSGTWVTGYQYQPANMKISPSGGVGTYYAKPMVNIQFLGTNTATGGNMYQITALGFGGNVNAVAVIQSIFSF